MPLLRSGERRDFFLSFGELLPLIRTQLGYFSERQELHGAEYASCQGQFSLFCGFSYLQPATVCKY